MNDVPWYVSLIIGWLPLLVLMGAGLWAALILRSAFLTTDGRSLAQAFDDHARELRRANDLFQEAIAGQRRRLEAQEQKS